MAHAFSAASKSVPFPKAQTACYLDNRGRLKTLIPSFPRRREFCLTFGNA
ncbi:hypothetical protein HMPREF9123_1564 [Neisseria bacilliformis ATCC BAA-1200]|uniref:Uncharacterized protein n=1 Tax=Neisseria bacilliformis ATCC BAA-1200 TaxID=888742 RepID=F2BD07_9NEIS|nr:hypothetical protein HMPREF9123_1564 [Neisseria bacilliformis ATCC BAA-1200]